MQPVVFRDVVAAGACEVMFLEVAKVLATCPHACPHHARASANLTAAIARRSIGLSRRILHVTPKTIRGKVLAYLSDEAADVLVPAEPHPSKGYRRVTDADDDCVGRNTRSGA